MEEGSPTSSTHRRFPFTNFSYPLYQVNLTLPHVLMQPHFIDEETEIQKVERMPEAPSLGSDRGPGQLGFKLYVLFRT